MGYYFDLTSIGWVVRSLDCHDWGALETLGRIELEEGQCMVEVDTVPPWTGKMAVLWT